MDMKHQHANSKSTVIVTRTKKTGTTRGTITAFIAMTIMFLLFAFTGTSSSVSAGAPVSGPVSSSSPDGAETLCEGGVLLTLF